MFLIKKISNFFFYIVLFIGFTLPNNYNYYLNLWGVSFQFREIAYLTLPFINIFCSSNRSFKNNDALFKTLWLFFFTILLITEVIKTFYYGDPLVNAFNTIRISLPFLSTMLLLSMGIKANIKVTWLVLNLAILVSAIITILSPFFNFSFLFDTSMYENVLEVLEGRLINDNASFGILGIYILSIKKKVWFNTFLFKIIAIFSIVILLLTFTRTYLALMVLAFIYCNFRGLFSLNGLKKIITYFIFMLSIVIIAYNSFELIKNQLDYRILSIINNEVSLSESVYEDVREIIFKGVVEKLSNGYWIFGLPLSIPIFYWPRFDGLEGMANTDTTFINVLLRFGLIPLILFLLIIFRLKTISINKQVYKYLLVFYGLASLNMDALMIHNSIFFFGVACVLLVDQREDTEDKKLNFNFNFKRLR